MKAEVQKYANGEELVLVLTDEEAKRLYLALQNAIKFGDGHCKNMGVYIPYVPTQIRLSEVPSEAASQL